MRKFDNILFKGLILVFIISIFYFYFPQSASLVYAFDACQTRGYYTHCESPNNPGDRWVVSPQESVLGEGENFVSLGVYGDVCKFDHSGSSYECPTGQVCQDDPKGPNDQTNKNPRCVPQAQQDQPTDCKCANPNDQSPNNNGITCTDPKTNKPIVNYKFCNVNQYCTDQPSPGTCTQKKCTCDSASGQGQNIKCDGDASSRLCPDNEVCTGNAGAAQCQPAVTKCTCDNAQGQSGGGGQNGYTCTKPDGSTTHANCTDAQEACQPDPSNSVTANPGIKCGDAGVNNVDDSPLPPPPSPPCKEWDNGQCKTFGSAIGDLATDPAGFVKTIFAVLLSFSGGIALLLIIRAGYQLITSQGKPEQIQQGRDQLVAAIVGLVFLIFAFVVLETIGVDILHLPGFTGTN